MLAPLPEPELSLAERYELPRSALYGIGMVLGIGAGFLNTYIELDFTLRAGLFVQVILAVLTVVVMHEGIHGLTAQAMGYTPLYGLKPPLVYITFTHKLPRGRFIAVALAPLVVLDTVLGLMLYHRVYPLYSDLALIVNTLGAAGDVWIALRLMRAPRGSWVQDTKTGIELWVRPAHGAH